MRLIDADALKKAIPNTHVDIFENCRNCILLDDEQVKQIIDDAPTIELLKEQEAVEPKTGHWIYKKYDDMFMCSSCEKYSIRNDYPYCHWCGAKMKQEGR